MCRDGADEDEFAHRPVDGRQGRKRFSRAGLADEGHVGSELALFQDKLLEEKLATQVFSQLF